MYQQVQRSQKVSYEEQYPIIRDNQQKKYSVRQILAILLFFLLFSIIIGSVGLNPKQNDQINRSNQDKESNPNPTSLYIWNYRTYTPSIDQQIKKTKQGPLQYIPQLQNEIKYALNTLSRFKAIQEQNKQILKELKQLHDFFNAANKQQIFKRQPQKIFLMSKKLKRARQIRFQLKLYKQILKTMLKKQQMEDRYQFFRENTYVPPNINIINTVPKQTKPLYIPTKEQLLKFNKKNDFIICTPAGRKGYLEILFKYLSKQKQHFWRWHIWENTDNLQDLTYLKIISQANNWIKIIRLPSYSNNKVVNIFRFWFFDTQQDKIYMRLDDDVVWMSQDFVQKMYKVRIQNPSHMLIYPNIINNQLINYIHQRAGIFFLPNKRIMHYYFDSELWFNPPFVKEVHEQFLENVQKNDTNKYKQSFNQWHLLNFERVSINSIIYFGRAIKWVQRSGDSYYIHQQQLFSTDFPHYFETKNLVISDPICVHQAFGTQRKFLESKHPQILQRYKKLIGL